MQTCRLSQTSGFLRVYLERRYHTVVNDDSQDIHCKVTACFVAFSLATFTWLQILQSTLLPMLCAITSELVHCSFSLHHLWLEVLLWNFVWPEFSQCFWTWSMQLDASPDICGLIFFLTHACCVLLDLIQPSHLAWWPAGLLLRTVHA